MYTTSGLIGKARAARQIKRAENAPSTTYNNAWQPVEKTAWRARQDAPAAPAAYAAPAPMQEMEPPAQAQQQVHVRPPVIPSQIPMPRVSAYTQLMKKHDRMRERHV